MMPTRMSLKKNLMAACSIGVLAVVVTGCSSNDKGVSPELAAAQRQVSDANSALAAARLASQDAAAEAAAKAAVALAAAEAAQAAAEAAQAAAEAALAGAIATVVAGFEAAGIPLSEESAAGDLDALGADLLDAATSLSDANAALTAAMMKAEADAMEIAALTEARDHAQAALTAVETALNAALADAGVTPGATMVASIEALTAALTEAQADLALVEEEVAAEKAKVAEAERGDRAKAIDPQLRLSSAIGGNDNEVLEGLEVSRSDGGTVTVEADDYDDATGTPDASGWTTVTLEKSGRDSTQTLRVYTNIGVPTYETLIKREGGKSGEFQVWGMDDGDAVQKWSTALPAESLIAPIRDADEAGVNLGAQTVGESNTVSGTMRWTFPGTFGKAKVPGTFVCTGGVDDCAEVGVTFTAADGDEDEKVVLTNPDGGHDWYFQPTNPNVQVQVDDEDYLAFGALTNTPDDVDDAEDYTFQTFFYGNDPWDHSGSPIGALLGSATYEGPAAGSYATTNSIEGSYTAGEFVAEAYLRANFETYVDGANALDIGGGSMLPGERIWGEITDFMEDGESLGNWRVDLGAAEINGNTFDGLTGLDIGKLKNANDAGVGTWNGGFYGNSEDYADGIMADDKDSEKSAAQPGGVAGEFTAQFGGPQSDDPLASTVIVGAFGATRSGN